VLSLDSAREEQFNATKRTLLTSLGVREFSERSNLAPSVATCVLPDAICSYCHHCTDLNLLHFPDAELRCDHCDQPYNLLELELDLVEHFNELSLKMCTQDLHCPKCRKVATTTMSTMCQCSGVFQPQIGPGVFKVRLDALRAVASKYSMSMLTEVADAFDL